MTGEHTLAAALDGYRADVLQAMVRSAAPGAAARTKADAVRVLADRLPDAARVTAAAAELDRPARALLERLCRLRQPTDWHTLLCVLVADKVVAAPRGPQQPSRQPQLPPAGDPLRRSSRAFQDVLARLELAGLTLGWGVQGRAATNDFGLAAFYGVPDEIRAVLPPPRPLFTSPQPQPESIVSGEPAAHGRGLYLVQSYCATRTVRLLQSAPILPKRDVAAAARELGLSLERGSRAGEEDIVPLYWARQALHDLGLLAVGPDRVLRVDRAAARAFWSLDAAQRSAVVLEAHLAGRWHNELHNLLGVVWTPQESEQDECAPDEVLEARRTVTAAVGQLLAGGHWMAVDDVVAAINFVDPGFLITGRPSVYQVFSAPEAMAAARYDASGNHQRWSFRGRHQMDVGWWAVEGRFITNVLEWLRHLGLLDCGLDAEGEVDAIRLGPMGRHVLTGAPPPEPDTGGRIVVQPNLRVVAFGPVPELWLMELDRFAERLSADRALEYTLTREGLYRGQQDGLDAAAVVSWLREASQADVPQNVQRTLEQWQAAHEQVVLRTDVGLLQALEPEDLAGLTAAAGDAVRRLSPTCAAVLDAPRVEAALAELGLTPVRHGPGARRTGLRLDESGTVTFRRRLPDVFTLGRVQQLAAWDAEEGVWRLSHASVLRASREAGMDAPAQIAAWRDLLGGVPEWLPQRIKAWSLHYGPAHLHGPLVLELPSEQALADVAADRELAAMLRPLDHGGPLVLVRPEDLERVTAGLEKLGIRMAPGEG